jgi:tetratricopeptide (TPR) repeat protein
MGVNTTSRLSVLALAGIIAAAPGAAAQQPGAAAPGAAAPGAAAPAQGQTIERRQAAYAKYIEAEKLERAGNFTGAVEAYKQAISLAPDDVSPRVALARLYLSNRNLDDARSEAEAALKVDAKSTAARSVLAEILVTESVAGGALNREKAKAAIAELEQITAADEKADIVFGPRSIKALSVLSQLYQMIDEDEKAIGALERLSKIGEGSSDTFTSVAELYFNQRKYRDAARAAEQARKLDATNLKALTILGQSLLRSGRAAEAVDVYKALLDAIPEPGGVVRDSVELQRARDSAKIEYAEALMQAGRYKEAVDTLKPVLERDPKNIRGVRVMTDAYRRSGDRARAVEALERSLDGQDVSESLELVFALAETYEEMEQFDKAIGTYEEALGVLVNPDGSVSPDDRQNAAVILRRIADIHRFLGQDEKVTEAFARMRKALGPDNAMPDMLEAQNLVETAQYDAAIVLARKAGATAEGDDKRTFVFLEAQALGRKGNLAEAVKLLEGLMTGGAGDDDVAAFMATIQLDGGDTVGAERSIRKALAADANDTGLLITLSSIQHQAKQYAESEKTLRRVLELDPENATALNNLGYFLAERNERLEEALALIQRAVNIDPTNGSFLDSLGWVYYQQNRLAEAKRYLEQAVIYEHQSATIREHLGDLYSKLGDMAKARKYWQEALRLSNETEETARIKGKLKE